MTVRARILAYAREVGWTIVPRREGEKQRGVDHFKDMASEQSRGHVARRRVLPSGRGQINCLPGPRVPFASRSSVMKAWMD